MSNEDFGHFGRRGLAAHDDIDDIKEQMAKERDAFFRDNWLNRSEPWPNSAAGPTMRSGIFPSSARSSLSGFPSGGLRRDFGEVGSRPAQRPMEDDFSNSSSLHRESIPISVHHERPAGGLPKHKYTGARGATTELPARSASSSNGSVGSPRLERAASEPPNKFNQKLNLSRPHYSTIPENSEGSGSNRAPHAGFASSVGVSNPIKTSASAPSVPDSRGAGGSGQPPPPTRTSPSRPAEMSSGAGHNMNAVPTAGSNVRHIPIFVEGRSEPIFNTNLSASGAGNSQQNTDMPFPKPSDYYPTGVQRIRSRDDTEPGTPDQSHPQHQQQQKVPIQEPTTPQGPPPGPIPMGYLPNPQVPIPEPTTPQGPPPGPIPMGYLPRVDAAVDPQAADSVPPPPCDSAQAETKPDGNEVAGSAPPPPPVRTKSSTIHPEKEIIHPESAESKSQVPPAPSASESADPPRAPSAEPKVNFIPIRVQHGRATSPRPQSSSRPASQELPANHRRSPRPAGHSPVPAEEPSKPEEPPKDPRISKLETIDQEAESLGTRVETFAGTKEDKEYRYLEDKLTKLLISADDISTDGISEIKQRRKESCNKLNKIADSLERKASSTS